MENLSSCCLNVDGNIMIKTNINDSYIVYTKPLAFHKNYEFIMYNNCRSFKLINQSLSLRENLANLYKETMPYNAIEALSDEMKKIGYVYQIVKNDKTDIPFGYYNSKGIILTENYASWKFYPLSVYTDTHIVIDTKYGIVIIHSERFVVCETKEDSVDSHQWTKKLKCLLLPIENILNDYEANNLLMTMDKYIKPDLGINGEPISDNEYNCLKTIITKKIENNEYDGNGSLMFFNERDINKLNELVEYGISHTCIKK